MDLFLQLSVVDKCCAMVSNAFNAKNRDLTNIILAKLGAFDYLDRIIEGYLSERVL